MKPYIKAFAVPSKGGYVINDEKVSNMTTFSSEKLENDFQKKVIIPNTNDCNQIFETGVYKRTDWINKPNDTTDGQGLLFVQHWAGTSYAIQEYMEPQQERKWIRFCTNGWSDWKNFIVDRQIYGFDLKPSQYNWIDFHGGNYAGDYNGRIIDNGLDLYFSHSTSGAQIQLSDIASKTILDRFSKTNGLVSGLPTSDLNAIATTSFYNFDCQSVANCPYKDGWGFVMTLCHTNAPSYAFQIIYPMNSSDNIIYYRRKMSDVWHNWIKLDKAEKGCYTTVIQGNGSNYYDLDLSHLVSEYGYPLFKDGGIANYSIQFYNGDGLASGYDIVGFAYSSSTGVNVARLKFDGALNTPYRVNYIVEPLYTPL